MATSKSFFWLLFFRRWNSRSVSEVWCVTLLPSEHPYHPWDWCIYLHEWLIFMVNVGKYTSPMDSMGHGVFHWPSFWRWLVMKKLWTQATSLTLSTQLPMFVGVSENTPCVWNAHCSRFQTSWHSFEIRNSLLQRLFAWLSTYDTSAPFLVSKKMQ